MQASLRASRWLPSHPSRPPTPRRTRVCVHCQAGRQQRARRQPHRGWPGRGTTWRSWRESPSRSSTRRMSSRGGRPESRRRRARCQRCRLEPWCFPTCCSRCTTLVACRTRLGPNTSRRSADRAGRGCCCRLLPRGRSPPRCRRCKGAAARPHPQRSDASTACRPRRRRGAWGGRRGLLPHCAAKESRAARVNRPLCEPKGRP